MRLTWRPLDLTLEEPFTISRSSIAVRHNVLVEIEVGGVAGRGEAEPTPYYGETAGTALTALERFDPAPLEGIGRDDSIEEIVSACAEQLRGHVSVLAALDAALWDVRGRQLGRPVWALLGAPGTCRVPTSYTIAIADPDAMARRAERAARSYKVLKVKVGTDDDAARLRAIREVTALPIRLDANAAWRADEARERVGQLAEFGIELVEQPCAREDIEGLARVREASPVPILADESCHTAADIPRLASAVDGVNVKLVKSGGLCEGARVVAAAGEHGMKVMIGCMTSSSLAITAAAHLAGRADFVDLDGNLLLAEDPFRGALVEDGVIQIPQSPGLGVSR